MTSPTLHATSNPSILRLLAAPVDTVAGVETLVWPVWLAVGTALVAVPELRDALKADDGTTTAKTPGATGWGVRFLGWPGVLS
jgi:hypothetical protein